MKQDNRNREDPSLHRGGEPGDESFVPESFSADYRGTSSLPLRADAEQELSLIHILIIRRMSSQRGRYWFARKSGTGL